MIHLGTLSFVSFRIWSSFREQRKPSQQHVYERHKKSTDFIKHLPVTITTAGNLKLHVTFCRSVR